MIKKADILILVLLFLIILSVFMATNAEKDNSGLRYVSIYSDGELKYSILLSESLKKEIVVNDFGYNKIVVSDNGVKVAETDCAGKDCMKFGTITNKGDIIVCAPHKLVIRIEGGEGLDAVSY